MKRIFFLGFVLSAALVSCRKIEVDGDGSIVVSPPNNGGNTPGRQTITLKGRIDSNMTLTSSNDYLLEGVTYIMPNRTLTIQPGVTVKASFSGSNVAALVITRDAKINASGTATQPVVFTSANPNPRSGDWGGIVICGRAGVNTTTTAGAGTFAVEGGINTSDGLGLAGGNNDDDSSGVLRYARIEYAGYAFQPDQEINSLTLAAVGRKTVIEYVQVSHAKDDAFEWFGGTVNCRYLVAYKTQDDDFDTDNGFSGAIQYGIIFRDSTVADISRSEAFESDNDAQGTANQPKTLAVFSNITAIGPRATLTNIGNPLYLAGAQIRRNSGISIYNSVFMGFGQGLLVDDTRGPVWDDVQDSTLRFAGNLIAGATTPFAYAGTVTTAADVDAWFRNPFYRNTILANNEQVGYTRPFDYNNPDFSPFASASVNIPGFPAGPNPVIGANNVLFTDARIAARTFIQSVTFRGAIGASGEALSWYKGWTRFGN